VSGDPGVREQSASILKAVGLQVEWFERVLEARQQLFDILPSIVVVDLPSLRAPDPATAVCGLVEAAREPAEGGAAVPVLLLTDNERFRLTAELVACGARDFLMTPFSGDELLRRVGVALTASNLARINGPAVERRPAGLRAGGLEPWPAGETGPGRSDLPPPPSQDLILGRSRAIRRVIEQVRLVARKDTTVLISGETGTGKERVAQAIHDLSLRSGQDRVSVNCGGIPAALLEDEFFGHVKGAFTDAHQARVGRFEQADGGTIFLDEIGDLPLELQPKLLRVLQEREIHRVGGVESVAVDVRVIAATNADLWTLVREGRFREDLFYRINVFPIELPPLRERREDIPLFVERFVRRFCERDGAPPKDLHPAAEAELMARPWPGNIRELENAVEIAVIRSRNRRMLQIEDFPDYRPAEGLLDLKRALDREDSSDYKTIVSRFEHDLISRTLEKTGGNKSQAAEMLGIKRTTLVEKLKKLNESV